MIASVFAQIADKVILAPTRHGVFAYGKTSRLVSWRRGQVEVWTEQSAGGSDLGSYVPEPEWFALKFQGKFGRAERANLHPFDHWTDVPGEIWSVNPPGYGGSTGPALLNSLIPAAVSVFEELLAIAGDRPIVLAAHSLGTASALYLAAHHPQRERIAGLVLHNPVPLNELLRGKYSRYSLGASRFLLHQVPDDLDGIGHAGRCWQPAVIVTCGGDRMVPPQFHRLIIDAYTGPRTVVELPKSGHEVRFSRSERDRYAAALRWLRERIEPAESRLLAS
jgi:pimeloyl-ACP methyl ester carboxylesterase